MSWFDTGSIAKLAKTALSDMQKQIDKALDINDDESARGKADPTTPDTPIAEEQKNLKNSESQQTMDSVWGSFTGSFFDGPQTANVETVTSPPKKQLSKNSSESESLEIISPPITPASTLSITSPNQVSSSIAIGSESVEIIGEDTPTSSELFSPGSVEVILEDLSVEESTVSEVLITVFESQQPPGKAMNRQNLHLLLTATTTTATAPVASSDSMANSFDSEQTISERKSQTGEEAQSIESFEYQTQSSTQSFEEICTSQQSTELSVKVDERKNLAGSSDPQRLRDQHSPNSSADDKSDVEIVKIGDQTSGDEIETATSSDIEIISSPNGDSSSTNSVPVKNFHKNLTTLDLMQAKKKGHCRELSEISLQSNASDDSNNQSETEKLVRKISELSDILEQREYKLVEIGRQNAELQEQNMEILSQLEAKQKQSDSLEVSHVTEEYTHRLSALEKKFQQSIRERDILRKQLNALKVELAAKINKSEADKIIADKEFMVEELRVEGEKLSKQVLQHSTIIKKLRSKEKDQDATIKRQKENIEELSEETERLKKSLTAKEDVERSQIEAVHRLSSDKRRLEKENLQIKSQLEDITQKLESLEISFQAAKSELNEKKNIHTDFTKQSEACTTLESDRRKLQSENEHILLQLDDYRQKLRILEAATVSREQNLRRENNELLRKLQEAEMRGEDEMQEITLATIPLVRQLESLQGTLNSRTQKFERQEKELTDKLDQLQSKLDSHNDHEAEAKEKIFTLKTTISSLEEKLQAALIKTEQTTSLLQQKQLEHDLHESERKNELTRYQHLDQQKEDSLNGCRQRLKELEESSIKEKEMFDSERKKLVQELKKMRDATDENTLEREGSPTLSLGGHSSLHDSLNSNNWQMDDLDCVSNSGRVADSSYGGYNQPHQNLTSVLESLQAALKQRDGEVTQLQWELSRLQGDKNYLTNEVGNLISELDTIKEKLINHDQLREQHESILQLYGEKLEENQELKLDLLDVKEAYKEQIDDLLQQKREGKL